MKQPINLSFDISMNLSNGKFVSVITQFPYAALHLNKTQNHCTIQKYKANVWIQFRRNCIILKVSALLTMKAEVRLYHLHDYFEKFTFVTDSRLYLPFQRLADPDLWQIICRLIDLWAWSSYQQERNYITETLFETNQYYVNLFSLSVSVWQDTLNKQYLIRLE